MAQKILELGKRADEHAHLVITFAGHEIAFHHFGKCKHCAFERGKMAIALLGEPHTNKCRNAEPECCWIEQGDIAADQTGSFELADAAQARAW